MIVIWVFKLNQEKRLKKIDNQINTQNVPVNNDINPAYATNPLEENYYVNQIPFQQEKIVTAIPIDQPQVEEVV
jgi:hypothetical protein